MSAAAVLVGYSVHWAATNRVDELGALRTNAVVHATREAAVAEARSICPPNSTTTTIVVEVRRSIDPRREVQS